MRITVDDVRTLTFDDGPVVGAAFALVDGGTVLDIAAVPEVDGRVHEVEGLALRGVEDARVCLLGVVDDDPAAPSVELELLVEFS